MTVHSVNEGALDMASASGKMQIGVTGVFAQYYRDQIVENTLMGQRQAADRGRWQNRANCNASCATRRSLQRLASSQSEIVSVGGPT